MGERLIVVNADRMTFEVDAVTLEPLGCSVYDAFAFTNPAPNQISVNEWQRRMAAFTATESKPDA